MISSKLSHIERVRWWLAARFGMFIHWGLYAIPARGEWVMYESGIQIAEYERLMNVFKPVNYNPRNWARLARSAGMRYMVLTTKHHDGFCLFDTKLTPFNAVNSPARRDLVREYVEACRAEGLGVGFYYSIKDWHHPHCPLDVEDHCRQLEPDARRPDPRKFLIVIKGQIRELLTNYGKVDILWFDGRIKTMLPYGTELARYIRSIQPDILINNRLGVEQDFTTPEQEIPKQPLVKNGRTIIWESCDTMTGLAWGYNKYDRNFRSAGDLIRRLVTAASSGGNYLLNVSPRADGTIQPEIIGRLRAMGRWMSRYADSIHNTEAGPVCHPPCGRMTRQGNRVYLHVFDWPKTGRLVLPALAGKLQSAEMKNGTALRLCKRELKVPRQAPDVIDSVLVLNYSGQPCYLKTRPLSRIARPRTVPVGYRVVRGNPILVTGHIDAQVWGRIRPLRFTPEGHFDSAAERHNLYRRDNNFAGTLRAMHAGNVLYLALQVETDKLYIRPQLDFYQNDNCRFFFAAGRGCTKLQWNPEAFEIGVDAAGRAFMAREDLYPGTVFRHSVEQTARGYNIVLAVPFALMRKELRRPGSSLRPGDTFRFNLEMIQSAPFPKIPTGFSHKHKAVWWEREPDPASLFVGCRRRMFWKGKESDNPFHNVTAWDVWKIEKK